MSLPVIKIHGHYGYQYEKYHPDIGRRTFKEKGFDYYLLNLHMYTVPVLKSEISFRQDYACVNKIVRNDFESLHAGSKGEPQGCGE
jgi:hypothetical protein